MSASFRLIAIVAAVAMTATTFVLPAYAAPVSAAQTVLVQGASR